MRTTPLARRLGSALLVSTLALGVAACGSGDSEGSGGSEGSAGSSGSNEEPGSEAEASEDLEELSADDLYPSVTAALREAETFAFTATTESGNATSTLEGEGRFTEDGADMAATSTGAQAMELIMLDKVVYMKSEQLGTGEKWLKIDLDVDGDSLFGFLAKSTDPELMYKAMEKPKKVELVGEEEVDGVATHHYRITIDPEEYMNAMGFPAEMAQFLPDELVTEMWVDADDLPRKYTQTVETPGIAGGEPTSSTTEGTYSDFGSEVTIEAPPESEVTEAPALPGAS